MTFRLITLLALGAATPALAQTSLAQASGKTPAGDDIVVTATRSGDAIPTDLVGSSVTVIDNQELQDRQVRTLSDVLRDVPGVAVNRTGGVGGFTEVRIRGSEGNHVLVFVDGIKLDDPYQGEYDFGTLLNDEASRVEILRGQQSSLYGSDAIGGVISYTTLSGRDQPGYSARIEGGSMGTYQGGARVAGVAGDTFDYALTASYDHSDGYRVAEYGDHDDKSNSLGASGKFNWTPAPNLTVTAVGRYSDTKADIADFGLAADAPVIDGYTVNTAIDSPGYHYTNRGYYGIVGATWSLFDDAWTNAISGQIADTTRDYFYGDDRAFGDKGRRYRGSFNSTVRFGNAHVRNRFTMGVDAEREEFRNTTPSSYADDSRHHIDTYGIVSQYDLTVDDRLAIGASARIDKNNRFKDDATYRATASYLFPTGTRIHAAYGTGVKNPEPSELFGYSDGHYLGNPDLAPEKSRGWEAGVEQSLLTDQAKIGATYFHSRLSDEIDVAGTIDALGNYVQTSYNNNTRLRQRGVETYAEISHGAWTLDATYTYLDAPQTIDALAGPAPADGSYQAPVPITAQASRRAKDIASANLTWAPAAFPLRTTVTVRYNGRQHDYVFNEDYNRILVDLKAFTLVNLDASYDIGKHLQVFGRIENLTGRHYQENFSYRGQGRAAYGGIRVKI